MGVTFPLQVVDNLWSSIYISVERVNLLKQFLAILMDANTRVLQIRVWEWETLKQLVLLL